MKFMRKKDQELEDLLEKSRQLQVELNETAAKAAKGLVWRRFVPAGSPEDLVKLGSLIERKALALDDLQLILQVLALPVSDGSCPVNGQVRMAFTDQTTTCPSYIGGRCIGMPPVHPPYTSRPVCPKTVSEEVSKGNHDGQTGGGSRASSDAQRGQRGNLHNRSGPPICGQGRQTPGGLFRCHRLAGTRGVCQQVFSQG